MDGHTFVPTQIENAIALNSTQFNLSRVLGPALAGLVMARFGSVGCFATNALSYLPFLAVILWILPKRRGRKRGDLKRSRTEPWYSEMHSIGKDPTLRGGLGISQALIVNGIVAILIHAWMYRSWACESKQVPVVSSARRFVSTE